MAPVSDVERGAEGSEGLSREDCLCPICLEIFMEPVTLPCAHTFCKACFLESVDKTTLCCPLCRKRVSTWARRHNRDRSLVNEDLWARIQRVFPQNTERRGAHDDTETMCFPRLSEPGALRREYEDQISKLTEEKRALEEQECRASEELIQRLLAEEEELLKQQRRRDEDDERLARLLSRELNSTSAESEQSRAPQETPVKKKPLGQIDRFLCPLSRSPAHISHANKENMLVDLSSEPPPLDFYGPQTDTERPRVQSPGGTADQPDRGDRPAEGGAKRKSGEAQDDDDETRGKRSCPSSGLVGVALAEWEEELQRRRRQEEEDLRLALELQRQLDRQQRHTDRRKGSEDAYLLRAARGTPEDTAPAAARKRPPAAATATLSTPVRQTQTTLKAAAVQRRHPPSATVTRATLTDPASDPAPPEQPRAFSPPLPAPKPAKPGPATPKTCPKTPQTCPKSKRQTTLTDLFNLHG
ncbi:hypothetical protein NL108_018341 [Boleophthalmus pectinirostris]|uniref:E3 ubiquitin-protein ligase rnf168 n=1 Tax=Boleophthalmus pectinirostris TaxID=150288 RepID=UPI00242FA2A3|nr:E3 ubiquitin-protein ligase rnf168 [Boleophthalmus pectinirostris]XP_055022590.1 E3 ubiquitin-protein ligase rnf168 [Boleophthalmus pectinirostris]XP_055022591.1 E3 ubiquitin-protein ligase rnf168 [Boleophthalmus pectinirostris]KAJ0064079.1 hypothetical protein NL108_018341 [Boleophthalmus pectinirostris]